jgi:hypothetical protein
VIRKTKVKAAWKRIRERYEAETQKLDAGIGGGWGDDETPSINDLIQREYREGRVTEPERDAMRGHVREWLPDLMDSPFPATYACGMWAPAVGPMGRTEHAIILSTVVILEAEVGK